MNAEGLAIMLWYVCLLVGIFGVIMGNLTTMLSALVAMICATVLIGSYRKKP